MRLTEASESDALSLALAGLSWPSWTSGVWSVDYGWNEFVDAGTAGVYAIQQGRCEFASPSALEAPVEAVAGDVILFPHGAQHTLTAVQPPHPSLMPRDTFSPLGDDEPPLVVVYGHFRPQRLGDNPLHGSLSSFLHLNTANHTSLQEMPKLIEMIVAEAAARRPGHDAIMNQLIQVMFHQSLRAFTLQRTASNDTSNPLYDDSAIGLVVGLLHAQPEKAWTVASLARWVRMSRSAFSERFREVVGKPPLQFLTELRMQRACELLTTTELGVKQIASMVGYESPSSFTNAFKRLIGVSPITWRQQGVIA